MNRIIIQQGDSPPETFPLRERTTLGRDRKCEVYLASREVSRVHAIVQRDGEGYVVIDPGSMNGSLLDGVPLKPSEATPIQAGQVLTLGDFEIRLDLTELAAPRALTPPLPPPIEVMDSAPNAPIPSEPPWESNTYAHLIEFAQDLAVWDGAERNFTVLEIVSETPTVRTIRMAANDPVRFRFWPGQHFEVAVSIEGQTHRRNYCISSSPSRPHVLEFTVQGGGDSLVSRFLTETLRPGQVLRAAGPTGQFSCVPRGNGQAPSKVLMLAAGIGIAPIMSMLRWISDTAATMDVVVLYSVRTPSEMIFRRELEWLGSRHGNISVIATLTDGALGNEAWTGLRQRVNGAALMLAAPDIVQREVYLSGPEGFAKGMRKELSVLGVPVRGIHQAEPWGFETPRVDGPPPLPQ